MTHKYKNMEWNQEGDEYILQECASDIVVYIEKFGSTRYRLTAIVAGFTTLRKYTKLSSAFRGAYCALKRLYDVTHRIENIADGKPEPKPTGLPPNTVDEDQQHRTHGGKRYRAVKSMGFCYECAFWNGRKCTLPMLDAALCVPSIRADKHSIIWQEVI